MKVNGIIAEYNPFHNGHKYHLEESLRRTGADFTVIVMSGDFVQRGAPAMLDKHARAEMALRCGADLVLELPVLYAASSAEFFAAGAVSLLDKLGVVTHLCFGSECGDGGLLLETARLLTAEPEACRLALKDFLRRGASYPSARAEALMQCYPSLKDRKSLFSLPNCILGLEYCKALLRRGSTMEPVSVRRLGAGYHDSLDGSCLGRPDGFCRDSHSAGTESICSAMALRQALREGKSPGQLSHLVPEEASELLCTRLSQRPAPLCSDDFSALLHYRLLLEKGQGYERYLDVSGDLSNRIQKNLNRYTGFEAFCALLKSRELTYTRISRSLLHILLDIRDDLMETGKKLDYVPYARVLGLRRSASPLFSAVKKHSSIPLSARLKDIEKSLGTDALRLLRQDILCGEIYRCTAARPGQAAVSEYSVPAVII